MNSTTNKFLAQQWETAVKRRDMINLLMEEENRCYEEIHEHISVRGAFNGKHWHDTIYPEQMVINAWLLAEHMKLDNHQSALMFHKVLKCEPTVAWKMVKWCQKKGTAGLLVLLEPGDLDTIMREVERLNQT